LPGTIDVPGISVSIEAVTHPELVGNSMSSTFIDISVTISTHLPVWPDDPNVKLDPLARTASGDPVNVSLLTCTTHTGTHVDAEWHFIDDGRTLDALTPDRLIGPCFVADLTGVQAHIRAADLDAAGIPEDATRVLLKTTNSQLWETSPEAFDKSYVGIAPDGAEWLVQRSIDLTGIDYHSVEPFDADGSTHRIMLGAGMVILETIDLRTVEPGPWYLHCLPLKLDGYDGAPCRAVLGAIG
jgi:arylformamidase